MQENKQYEELEKIVFGQSIEKIENPEIIEANIDPRIVVTKNIKLSNKYIEVKTNRELSVYEARFLLLVISAIQSQDLSQERGCYVVKISKKAIKELITGNYSRILDALPTLIDRVYWLETSQYGKQLYSFFIGVEYLYYEDYVRFIINPFLNEYIVDLKQNYTMVKLQNIFGLRKAYSVRLYMLLKRFADTGFRFDELEDLKEKLGCGGKYKEFFNFENRVLIPCVNEINVKTDLKVNYKKVIKNKKIYGIEFYIESVKNFLDEWMNAKFESSFVNYVKKNMKSIRNPIGFLYSLNEDDLKKFIKNAIEDLKRQFELQIRFDDDFKLFIERGEYIFQKNFKLAFLYLFEKEDRDIIVKIIKEKNILQ